MSFATRELWKISCTNTYAIFQITFIAVQNCMIYFTGGAGSLQKEKALTFVGNAHLCKFQPGTY